jgi:hypothetical protein
MKAYRVFIACLLGLSQLAFTTNSAASETQSKQAAVTISYQRLFEQEGFLCVELVLSNCTSQAVWFDGHGAHSPLYQIQSFKDRAWKDLGRGSCLTGVERRSLGSHESFKFTAVLIESGHVKSSGMRVGLSCSPKKDFEKEFEKIYWSEKIEIKR